MRFVSIALKWTRAGTFACAGIGLCLMLPHCGQVRVILEDFGDIEVCDGIDNNGNGLVDESDPLDGHPCTLAGYEHPPCSEEQIAEELCSEGEPSPCHVTVLRCDRGRGMACRLEPNPGVCGNDDGNWQWPWDGGVGF